MMVWHYTVGHKMPAILDSGVLHGSRVALLPGERPIVWFSSNDRWEPTANKAVLTLKGIQVLTTAETRALCGGLFRFGMESSQLTPWPEIAAVANMKPYMRDALEQTGVEQDSTPSNWCGTICAVPIELTLIEIERKPFAWTRYSAYPNERVRTWR